MERCLLIKDVNDTLVISVSEHLCREIMSRFSLSERQVSGLLEQKSGLEMTNISLNMAEREGWKGADSFFVKDRDYFRRVNFSQIRWVEASGSYCNLCLNDAPKLMLSFNLSELWPRLPQSKFLRVHRSYIVNISYIDSFIGNMLCIGKDRIPVSKQHRSDIIARLNILGTAR